MIFAVDSSRDQFVDLDVSPTAWMVLAAALVSLLTIDLIRHREAHDPTASEALNETLGFVFAGLSASVVIGYFYGSEAFGEYISGYLIEKSLSIDNVFVWAILFSTMKIPLKHQHRVLFWGVLGALFFRLVFILLGSALITRFSWLLVVFGLFLVFTGLKIIRHRDDEGEEASTVGLKLLRRVMPVSDTLDGDHFFTKQRVNGAIRWAATPLFAALVVIEFTDIIFAVDSVPAVLAVSHEPFIVFSSNAFAILGLRAMYFLLANARERFHYLSHGLGGVLIFVGLKMTLSPWYHMNTFVSLGIILIMLLAAIGFSILKARSEPSEASVD